MLFKSFDGKNIYVRVWDNVLNPVGTVQIVHGMAEYAGKYGALAEKLNALGYVVYADDHRGHGETDFGTLGYSEGDMFSDTVRDVVEIADYFDKEYPDVKHVLLAHSYGSFISQRVIADYPDKFDGVILYGSNYKKDFETYFGAFVASLGCILPGRDKPARLIEKLSFGAYEKKFKDKNWLSTQASYKEEYDADEFCGFTCSYGFYKSFLSSLTKLYTAKYAEQLNKDMPLLLISGDEDPVGNMGKGVEKLYRYYKSRGMKHVQLHLIKGARHVLLYEKQEYREDFINTVVNFIEGVKKK